MYFMLNSLDELIPTFSIHFICFRSKRVFIPVLNEQLVNTFVRKFELAAVLKFLVY